MTGDLSPAPFDADCRDCAWERTRALLFEGDDPTRALTHRMIVCPACGDKRCPRAQSHNEPCPKETTDDQ